MIGHPGGKRLPPGHTLGSYQVAAELRVDYIEPDLVSTVAVSLDDPGATGATTLLDDNVNSLSPPITTSMCRQH